MNLAFYHAFMPVYFNIHLDSRSIKRQRDDDDEDINRAAVMVI